MSGFRDHNFKLMLDQELLSARGHNFVRWGTTLRTILRNLEWLHVLTAPLPNPPPCHDMNGKPVKEFMDEEGVMKLMMSTMSNELAEHFKNARPVEIMDELKLMFRKQVRVERYKLTKPIWNCKLKEGGCMHQHEVILVGLFKRLEF